MREKYVKNGREKKKKIHHKIVREREREREPFFVREKYIKNGKENDKFIVRGCE